VRQDEHGRFVKSEPKRDPVFVSLVHRLPCCALELPGHVCSGPLEAHHAGPRSNGASEKADDDTCIPMCKRSHTSLHAAARMPDGVAFFRTCGGPGLRAWEDRHIEATRVVVERMRAGQHVGPSSDAELPW
jgi:hypothetical protein